MGALLWMGDDRSPGEKDLSNSYVNRWSLKPGSRRNHLEEITELSKGTARYRGLVRGEVKAMQDQGQEARGSCAKGRELSTCQLCAGPLDRRALKPSSQAPPPHSEEAGWADGEPARMRTEVQFRDKVLGAWNAGGLRCGDGSRPSSDQPHFQNALKEGGCCVR